MLPSQIVTSRLGRIYFELNLSFSHRWGPTEKDDVRNRQQELTNDLYLPERMVLATASNSERCATAVDVNRALPTSRLRLHMSDVSA